ncbi:alanine racemase [Anaeromyxobacter diazotrophicus]|uniref:Alanine racemase n=1 Tax=Anaeromyxobacter diazotrophicus TaxID=2590199 RepID=A0A7I9VS33_9BACT|nr:alanine racemase [Anaeromyxobacter diazotrophicus]
MAAVDTPALVLDLDAMERNLERMAAFARSAGVRLRPHAKMHKSAELARLQLAAGAVGVCVQKPSEAERLAEGGVDDLYLSNEVVSPEKLERVAALAGALAARGGRLALAVDSPLGVARLAAAVAARRAELDVLVEIDVGQGRCGVPVPEGDASAAIALARAVARSPGLRFAGLQAYHGNAQHVRSVEARRAAVAASAERARAARQALEQAGIPVPLVTGAGTGTFAYEAASGVYGELQPGSYLFMDRDYADNERDPAVPRFEHALFVKAEVMSVGPRYAVVDAGHKSHAVDSGAPRVHDPSGRFDLRFETAGDEHGLLWPVGGSPLPALGDAVWLVPGHCDPTVNLHDGYVAVRGGLVEGRVDRLIRVDARGAIT